MARPLLSTTPRQEQEFQQRATAQLARRMEPAFRRELADGMRKIAQRWDDDASHSSVIRAHARSLERLIKREYTAAFEVFGDRILDGAKRSFRVMQTKNLSFEDLRDAWIRTYSSQKVTEISGTTLEQARRIIQVTVADAISEGLGEAAIGRAVESAMRTQGGQLSTMRSRVIARTESHTAANAATQEAARSLGFPMHKEWVAAADERTREDHARADGEMVVLDGVFRVGGHELKYPGDPDGPPEQIIQCRCAAAIMVD